MKTTIEIKDASVRRALSSLGDAVENSGAVLSEIGATITENIRLGFHNSEDPYGRPWKKVLRAGGQPLRNTGQLANSWTYSVSRNAIRIGSNLSVSHKGRSYNLASIHQNGAIIKPVNAKTLVFSLNGKKVFAKSVTIPQRKMVPDKGWPKDWRSEIEDIVSRHIKSSFR